MNFLCFLMFNLTAIASIATPSLNADEWKWSDENANLMHYFMRAPKELSIQLIRNKNSGMNDVEIRIGGEEESQLEFDTHREGSFVFSDQVVIYAQFSMIASGCELVAFDLNAEKELWRKSLEGLGPIPHSKYRNRINLELNQDSVTVYGLETGGRYIEKRLLKTGDLVAHIRF